LEQTLVGPALPAIERHYRCSPTAAAWVLTGFLLVAAVATVLGGRLGDQYGRRRVLLVSLVLFACGSLVCALGDSIGVVIVGRIVQALGTGMGPLALALARENVEPGRVPMAMGVLVAAGGVGAAIGLLLVGPIVDDISVPALFWFLFLVALALIPAVLWAVDESSERLVRPVDLGGALVLVGGLGCLMLAISEAGDWGWGGARTVALFVSAGVLLAAFWVRERTASSPLIDPRVLGRRSVWSSNAATVATGFSLFIGFTLTPLIAGYPRASGYGLGLSTTQIGLILLPSAIFLIVGAMVGARLVKRTGARSQAVLGAGLVIVSYLLLLSLHRTAVTLALAPIPGGVGNGLLLGALADLVVLSAGDQDTAGALALNSVMRTVASALGAQIAVALVVAAPKDALGLPANSGFTAAFGMAAIAMVIGLGVALLAPSRAEDPVVALSV
jgi:MFS family permease